MVVDGIKVRCKLTESREGGTSKVTVKYCVGYDADDPKAVNAWPQYGCANSSPMTRSLRSCEKKESLLPVPVRMLDFPGRASLADYFFPASLSSRSLVAVRLAEAASCSSLAHCLAWCGR